MAADLYPVFLTLLQQLFSIFIVWLIYPSVVTIALHITFVIENQHQCTSGILTRSKNVVNNLNNLPSLL